LGIYEWAPSYPQQFPAAPPLRAGKYRVRWFERVGSRWDEILIATHPVELPPRATTPYWYA